MKKNFILMKDGKKLSINICLKKLTKELVDAFVSEIVFSDNNIEVKLLYDDFLKELLEVADEREVSSNG